MSIFIEFVVNVSKIVRVLLKCSEKEFEYGYSEPVNRSTASILQADEIRLCSTFYKNNKKLLMILH